jgi:hypothetical protein
VRAPQVAAFCNHFVKAASTLVSPQPPAPESPHDETQSSSPANINDGGVTRQTSAGAFVPGHEDSIQGSSDRHPNSYPRDPVPPRSREGDHDDLHPGIHHPEDSRSDSAAPGTAGYLGVYQNVSVCHMPFRIIVRLLMAFLSIIEHSIALCRPHDSRTRIHARYSPSFGIRRESAWLRPSLGETRSC